MLEIYISMEGSAVLGDASAFLIFTIASLDLKYEITHVSSYLRLLLRVLN
jgi:hypothetical protein